jgi:CMP-N-acetylneuraminic acid synthetase
MKMEITAIITARGGSKGVPRKNIRVLNGKPLVAHSIIVAQQCSHVNRCIVSTEDSEIRSVCLRWGAEVIDRPRSLARDHSLSRDVVRHVLESLKRQGGLPEYFILLQPTSPLRTVTNLESCITAFWDSDAKCAISVTKEEHHPHKMFQLQNSYLEPLFGWEELDKPRQFLPSVFRQNGAIYLMSSVVFLKENSFFVPPILPFVMTMEESVDIDSEFDIRLCEALLSYKSN